MKKSFLAVIALFGVMMIVGCGDDSGKKTATDDKDTGISVPDTEILVDKDAVGDCDLIETDATNIDVDAPATTDEDLQAEDKDKIVKDEDLSGDIDTVVTVDTDQQAEDADQVKPDEETISDIDEVTTCKDNDSDGKNGYDAIYCSEGTDKCDNNKNNWTTTGCASCVDNDSDGYGTNCDKGADCDDSNSGIYENCCTDECFAPGVVCETGVLTECYEDNDGCFKEKETNCASGNCEDSSTCEPVPQYVEKPVISAPTACEEVGSATEATLSFTVPNISSIDHFTIVVKETTACNAAPTGDNIAGYPKTAPAALSVNHTITGLKAGTYYKYSVESTATGGFNSNNEVGWFKTAAAGACTAGQTRYITCEADSGKIQKQTCSAGGAWDNTGECYDKPAVGEMALIPAGSFWMGSPTNELGRYTRSCLKTTSTNISSLFLEANKSNIILNSNLQPVDFSKNLKTTDKSPQLSRF